MPCEHDKGALIEAASGVEPQGELRAHLESCDSCRAAFAEEQALFASIDAGLHAKANAEVPVSLLPRVRARLDETGAPINSWITNRFVLATAAVVVVAFFAARAVRHTNVGNEPVEKSVKTNAPPKVKLPPQNQSSLVASTAERNDVLPRQFRGAKTSPVGDVPVRRNTLPEVLVPRDQEILLAAYAEQWNLHKRAPLVAKDSDAAILARLQIAPIQIDELGVKLLAEEKWK
jgi:hypothetical protein